MPGPAAIWVAALYKIKQYMPGCSRQNLSGTLITNSQCSEVTLLEGSHWEVSSSIRKQKRERKAKRTEVCTTLALRQGSRLSNFIRKEVIVRERDDNDPEREVPDMLVLQRLIACRDGRSAHSSGSDPVRLVRQRSRYWKHKERGGWHTVSVQLHFFTSFAIPSTDATKAENLVQTLGKQIPQSVQAKDENLRVASSDKQ